MKIIMKNKIGLELVPSRFSGWQIHSEIVFLLLYITLFSYFNSEVFELFLKLQLVFHASHFMTS